MLNVQAQRPDEAKQAPAPAAKLAGSATLAADAVGATEDPIYVSSYGKKYHRSQQCLRDHGLPGLAVGRIMMAFQGLRQQHLS